MGKLLGMLVIGVVYGSIYGFIAIGMVLIYRTTGVLNIAHGGIGILCAYVARELFFFHHEPYYVGLLGGVLFGAILGLLFYWIVLKRLEGQPLLQTASTLGLYVLLQGVTFLPDRWTDQPFQAFPSPLTEKRIRVPGTAQYLNGDQ